MLAYWPHPYLPPSGKGEAERAIKNLLRDTSDHNLALLTYRSTPLSWCKHSPAQLLMGRQIRSTLPISTKSLMPKWPHLNEFCKINQHFKNEQKKNHDRRHLTSELSTFEEDEPVFVVTDRDSVPVPGRIVHATRDRSYVCGTNTLWSNKKEQKLYTFPS